jgi:hypothetical protein
MTQRHKSLADLWDEWHGLLATADEYDGIAGRNKEFGSKWRETHLNAAHSRTQRYQSHQGLAVHNNVKVRGRPLRSRETFLLCKSSVSNFVQCLYCTRSTGGESGSGKKASIELTLLFSGNYLFYILSC